MGANRVWEAPAGYDPVGTFTVGRARRTALLAIEEVLGGSAPAGASGPRVPVLETGSALPATVPAPRRISRPGMRRMRRRRKARGRLAIVALMLALALGAGAALGSGLLSPEARFNARLVAAEQNETEVDVLPEVYGHPGSAPKQGRSDSIRQFLGMASAF